MAAPGVQMVQGQVPGPQSQAPGGQQPQGPVQQGDIDPISKFRLLLPRLKDALVVRNLKFVTSFVHDFIIISLQS